MGLSSSLELRASFLLLSEGLNVNYIARRDLRHYVALRIPYEVGNLVHSE